MFCFDVLEACSFLIHRKGMDADKGGKELGEVEGGQLHSVYIV